jgi:hypothetical protein
VATTAGALIVAAALGAAGPPAVVVENSGDLFLVSGGKRERLTRHPSRDGDPALAPDGRRLAFVSERDGTESVYLLELRTGHVTPVAPGRQPAWSQDGRLAYATDEGVVVGDAVVAPGAAEPAWSLDGKLAVVLPDGVFVDGTLVAPGGRSPAWAPDGRLAYVVGSDVYADGALAVAGAVDPAWDPSGRLTVSTAGGILVDGAPIAGTRPGDVAASWGRLAPPAPKAKPKPDPNELLPDLDQRAPSGLSVSGWRGRWTLGFTSATDNVGQGPAWFRGIRPNGRTPTMRADQLIRLRNGKVRVVRGVGLMRYTWAASHSHWHVLRFQQYELRSLDGKLLVRDHKTGFCLADHYGLARHRVVGFRGPSFFGNCGQGRPDLLAIEQGTSIGFTDRYPAHFHGQNVDISRVPAGLYVLVHRANPSGRIRERTLANNAASVRIRITRPGGFPRVRILRLCEGSASC